MSAPARSSRVVGAALETVTARAAIARWKREGRVAPLLGACRSGAQPMTRAAAVTRPLQTGPDGHVPKHSRMTERPWRPRLQPLRARTLGTVGVARSVPVQARPALAPAPHTLAADPTASDDASAPPPLLLQAPLPRSYLRPRPLPPLPQVAAALTAAARRTMLRSMTGAAVSRTSPRVSGQAL